jgi:hypothetical protein
LLGEVYIYGNENSTRSDNLPGMLSSFGDGHVSAGKAEDSEYLKNLITDSEIEQIRSENKNLVNRLLSVYVFEDATKIRSFLEDHPSVPDVLSEAAPFLIKSFGESAILQLQIPPDEDIPVAVYAVALWDGPLEDARAALRAFDQMWWTANSQKTSGRIVFDYQLV